MRPATITTVAVLDVPLAVAVKMHVCEFDTVPAVALNVALVAPAATVTVAGAVSAALLLLTPTEVAATVAWLSVTVQALMPAGRRLDGLHASEVIEIAGSTVREAVFELVPRAAVTTTDWELVTVPAVALKVALVAPAATDRVAGAVSAALLLVTPTEVAVSAAWLSVMVQVLMPPATRLDGLHASDVIDIAGRMVREAVFELVPRTAVTTIDWELVTVPAVALKVAVVAPAATVTVAGTESDTLLLVTPTDVAATAAWLSVIAQVLTPAGRRLEGLHTREEMSGVLPPPDPFTGAFMSLWISVWDSTRL
jgi:hypothetical protein